MINNSTQSWQVGEVVQVGFMRLRITSKIPTPGNHKPDEYMLCGLGNNADRNYKFTPHHGIERV